jgi:hypothetical protein
MKKLLLSVAVVATMGLASCGDDEAASKNAMCECINAKGDPSDDCKALEKEWTAKYEKASDEDKKKLDGEMKACKKEGDKAAH